MSTFNPKNLRSVADEMPPCCGHCKWNDWDEWGPHCRNPENWENDEFEKAEEITKLYMEDDDGEIEWQFVCDLFESH